MNSDPLTIRAVLVWVIGRLDRCHTHGLIEGGRFRLSEQSRPLYEELNKILDPPDETIREALRAMDQPEDGLDYLVTLVKASDRDINRCSAAYN